MESDRGGRGVVSSEMLMWMRHVIIVVRGFSRLLSDTSDWIYIIKVVRTFGRHWKLKSDLDNQMVLNEK